jgi:dolichol-phosphate mannosyltransferase
MVYFLIPVYNEEKNLKELSNTLKSSLPGEKKHFVFVNDCSTDSTVEILKQSFSHDELTILTNKKNSGPGFSFNSGFEYILSVSDDNNYIITMEGDNTSDPGIMPVMFDLASDWKYDLVLASVYAQGGGFDKTSFFRKIISFIANQLLRFVYGIKVLTLSSFYRVYRVSMVRRIKEKYSEIISESGFICMLEILIKTIRLNAKIIEVPMILKSTKRTGKSKMKIMKTSYRYLRFLMKRNIY